MATPPPLDAPVLVVQRPWIEWLLDGTKRLEIRRTACRKPLGTTVYLSESGTGAVQGSVRFEGSFAIPDASAWEALRDEHRVPDAQPSYGAATHAWRFAHPVRLPTPQPYVVKPGAIIWRKFRPPEA